MGLLDGLVKAGLSQVFGGGKGGNQLQSQVVEALLQQVLGKQDQGGLGGLGNLVNMMQKNGLGDAVQSWVGDGQNQQINPEQVQQGFDPSVLANIASQLGVSKSETAGQLSQVLPELINKLTPQGQADNELGIDDAIRVLGKFLK